MSITNFKKIIKYRVIHFKTIVWFTKGLILKICKSDEHQNFKILAIKKPEYAFLASICCKSLLAVHPNSSIEVVCDQFTKIDGMNEYIADICDVTHQNLGLPKKVVKKLAVSKHKQNLSQVVAENNELESLYEAISKV
mgnify:CR=1 FL=1